MARNTVSHAQEIFAGNAVKGGHFLGQRGLPWSGVYLMDLGAPAALSANGVINATAVGGAGLVTLNGALVSGGVATLGGNFGRGISIVSSGAGDTTQTVTARGFDAYNEPMTETISANGTTTVQGLKAFKRIASVTASAAFAGNLSVGVNDKLGFGYRLDGNWQIINSFVDGTSEAGTRVFAVTTSPATAITGDVRGTITPTTATNGTRNYRVQMIHRAFVSSVTDNNAAFGVAQFAG
jgi:hypothetical protein